MIDNHSFFYSPIMRINAHLASAILPTDNLEGSLMVCRMRSRDIILEEIAEQKEQITTICAAYNVKTTHIATKAGVAASTINRFMATKEPKSALSAITMRKIKASYPISHDQNLTQAEMAIVYVLKEVIDIIQGKREANKKSLLRDLGHAVENYRAAPGAIAVLDALLVHIRGDGLAPEQHTLRQMLQLAPPEYHGARK